MRQCRTTTRVDASSASTLPASLGWPSVHGHQLGGRRASGTAWHSEPQPATGHRCTPRHPSSVPKAMRPQQQDGQQQRAATATTEDTASTAKDTAMSPAPQSWPEARNREVTGGRSQVIDELLTHRSVPDRAPGDEGKLPSLQVSTRVAPGEPRGPTGAKNTNTHSYKEIPRHYVAGRWHSPPSTLAPSGERKPTGTVSALHGPDHGAQARARPPHHGP